MKSAGFIYKCIFNNNKHRKIEQEAKQNKTDYVQLGEESDG